MYVNGRRVVTTLDGLAIDSKLFHNLLQNGAALPAALAPFQHLQGFRFESNGLGTFSVNIPRQVSWNVTYNGPNDDRGTANPVYLGSNNYTFSFGAALSGGDPPPPPKDKTPCADFARAAQNKVNEWINNWENAKAGNSWTVEDFDRSFTPYYIGMVANGKFANNFYFYQTGGGVGKAPKVGQQDFKEKYLDVDYERDSDDPQADQVHHLAAYLSAGINGAAVSGAVHNLTETAVYRTASKAISDVKNGTLANPLKKTNQGDIDLAHDAYDFGKKIRENPINLNTIGQQIRDLFCQ